MRRDPLLTRPFGLVFGAHFFHALALNLFLHLPGFLKALGASEPQIGLLFGMTGGMAVVARPLLGPVMDARGQRILALGGGLLHVIITALYLTVDSTGPLIYVIRAAHGVAMGTLFLSLFALVAEIVPPSRRIEGFAIFGISGLAPVSLGALLGDTIMARGGYAHLFVAASALALLATLVSVPLRDSPRSAAGEPSEGIVAAARQRDLVPIWIVGFSFATTLAACFAFFKTYVLATGVGSVGLFFSAYTGSALVLRLLFGSLPERLGPKRALTAATGLMALGLAVLTMRPTVARHAAAGLLCGLGHGYTVPILMGLVVARSKPSQRGSTISIYTALFDGGLLIGGPALGLIVEAFGYQEMFGAAAAFVVAGSAIFIALDWGRS